MLINWISTGYLNKLDINWTGVYIFRLHYTQTENDDHCRSIINVNTSGRKPFIPDWCITEMRIVDTPTLYEL